MLLIPCPWCGPRPEDEFVFGGEAHLRRPGPYDAVSDQQWADYLFMRANAKGRAAERWCHLYGCRQWFHMVRDTFSHRIEGVYGIDEDSLEAEA